MLKRLLALILALVLCLGVFVGCQPTDDQPSDGPGESTGGENDGPGPLFDKVTKFEIATILSPTYEFNDSYLDKLLLEQENIDITMVESKIQQALVDHDLPDITYMDALMYGNEYGPKGAFLNVLEHLDKMPNLKAYLMKYPDVVKKNLATDNGLYHIPVIVEGSTTTYGFIYRTDLFEKHDLTFPTTRDEFYNTLKKLKELYPNSYPFVLRQMTNNMQGFMYLTMGFGTELALTGSTQTVMSYNHKTGEWYHAPTSEGMKDMITFMHQLYAEGLLHQSSITMTDAQWIEAFAKGDTAEGVSFIGWDKMDRIPAVLQPAGEALNPDFELRHGAPIKFNDLGEAGVYVGGVGVRNFLIAKDTKNLDNVLKYIDWLYSEEGITTTNWGKEGDTFEYDADGNKKYTDTFLADADPQYTRGFVYAGAYGVRDFEAYAGWQTELQKENMLAADKWATLPGRPSLKYNEEEQAIYDTYAMSIHTAAKSELQKFIAGERDLAEWDAYVAEIESDTYMFNDLLKIHEDAYKRMQEAEVDVEKLLNGGVDW